MNDINYLVDKIKNLEKDIEIIKSKFNEMDMKKRKKKSIEYKV